MENLSFKSKRSITNQCVSEFKSGQSVMVSPFYQGNEKLPDIIEPGIIYHISEIQRCECGAEMLVLKDIFEQGVSSRICLCGNSGFKANAFFHKRFLVLSGLNHNQIIDHIDKSIVFFQRNSKYVNNLLDLRIGIKREADNTNYKMANNAHL